MAQMHNLGPEADALAHEEAGNMALVMMARFGTMWGLGPWPPTAAQIVVGEVRRELVLPMGYGFCLAMARFFWETAPPGASAAQLFDHLSANILRATMEAADERPAGSFWLHVEATNDETT